MRLRNRADRRTWIWAFLFMPAAVALHYARPALSLWLAPVSFYLAYCAGVIMHNHNHCPTFTGRRANAFLSAWLSFFYGFPTFAWIPTHNRNHHRYVNRPGDATITSLAGARNTPLAAARYFFASAAGQAPLIARFLREVRCRDRRLFAACLSQYAVVFGGHAAALSLALLLHGPAAGAIVYLASLGAPALGALWGLAFTNYVQHVDCDARSRWNHSRNFVSRWMNYLVFDNGFHTVHHERPGLHWSRLREEHAKIVHLVDPRLIEGSILGYCLKAYVLGRAPAQALEPVA
ncbi:MAG: fatty acid desaturase [Myxococcales bacterium]|nr:fatty acid desaturase [Myxococcales bacterium]